MLDEIIKNKRLEIEKRKKLCLLDSFKSKIEKSSKNFKQAISKNKLSLIAEIKKKSPSHGHFENSLKVEETIRIYNKYAAAISVLTDEKFFSGSLDGLKHVKTLTNLPVLQKDFIIDEYQIYESRRCGADAILIIASLLSLNKINDFIELSRRLGMGSIVEVHNEPELKKALKSRAEIIGINNRDLKTLKVDTSVTLRLSQKIPHGKIIVSESGINSKKYVNQIKNKVNAILVGTYFMESENLEKSIKSLIK